MSLQNIKYNANRLSNSIDILKKELEVATKEYNKLMSKQLREENARLEQQVEDAKQKLISLELQNGIKQIPVPSSKTIPTQVDNQISKQQNDQNQTHNEVESEVDKKKVKDKKPKKAKEVKETVVDLPIDISRLDLRIGHIVHVEKHPEADSLYLLKIDCGEDKPRTVCSGLVKHISIDQLKDRNVVVLCNLKPVKMRGIVSEAMVMCASCETAVEVLTPPNGSSAGDLVECEGYVRDPDDVMNPKKKIFETVAVDLCTNDLSVACYKNKSLIVVGKGNIKATTLKNVPIK